MPDLRITLPAALARQTRFERLAGSIPALLAHPDWQRPAPAVIWMHGERSAKSLIMAATFAGYALGLLRARLIFRAMASVSMPRPKPRRARSTPLRKR